MLREDTHLSDQDLLSAVDGELAPWAAARVESHLAACWQCRARKQEFEAAIGDFVREHRRTLDGQIPPPDGPRALLRAQLSQVIEPKRSSSRRWFLAAFQKSGSIAVGLAMVLGSIIFSREFSGRRSIGHEVVFATPNPNLTPGATVLLSRGEVCRESNAKNKIVPVAMQRRVFQEYGIAGADPRAYEVDYLVTPALGGADDIHNLWPHAHFATEWNAEVKDALEDRLRDLVCAGDVDLADAQREIATNWIGAYKKYFHTDRPLPTAR